MTAVVAGHLRDAARWLISGALVLAAHGGVAAVLVSWSDPLTPGMLAPLVLIELAPAASAPSLEKTDLPIDRPQEPREPTPELVDPAIDPPKDQGLSIELPPLPPALPPPPELPPPPSGPVAPSGPSKAAPSSVGGSSDDELIDDDL